MATFRSPRLRRAVLPALPLALAAVPSASAAIIFTDPSDLTISAGSSIFIDMGTAGGFGAISTSSGLSGKDFQLTFAYSNSAIPKLFLISSGSEVARFGGQDKAVNFSLGATIDSGAGFSGSNTALNNNGNNDANWAAGTAGFLGVKFDADDTAGTSIVFSWILVTYNSNSTLTVHSFAYEASGAAILAGDTGDGFVAIPEPAETTALATLLAGSIALYARRRLRKKAA